MQCDAPRRLLLRRPFLGKGTARDMNKSNENSEMAFPAFNGRNENLDEADPSRFDASYLDFDVCVLALR